MTVFEALIQGVIQGLTEFLPISSSGHLSIFQYLTGQSSQTGALFAILLHLGTLVAVFIAFHKIITELIVEFFMMIRDIFTRNWKNGMNQRRRMLLLLMLSLVPTLAAVLFKDFFEALAGDNDIIVEGICLIATGTLLLLGDRFGNGRKKAGQMTAKDALAIGAAQGVALLPGLSRSGSTVSVGLMRGLERQYAVAFSFIMGIPAVLGANILEFKNIQSDAFGVGVVPMVVGLLAAAVFGMLAIRLVRIVITTDKFKYFAYYAFAVGSLTVALGLIEAVTGHVIQRMIAGG